MQRRVRVLNGPLRGVTHTIRERLGIGRASSSDIQLVHDGISRQHAQIVTDEQGRHVLVDLESSNGTYIDGKRIRRQALVPGTIFKIMGVKLVYEPDLDQPVEGENSEVYALYRVDRDTLRGNAGFGEADAAQPAAARPRVTADTGPAVADEGDAGAMGWLRADTDASSQARSEERHRVVATRQDGSTYEGSLIDDIVAYRELRIRFGQGDTVSPTDHAAFEELERKLRMSDPPSRPGAGGDKDTRGPSRRGSFNRFLCNFPARLRLVTGDELSAGVLDLGVDGARVRAYDHQIEHDAIVWLAIHIVSRGLTRTVVLTGRVAWTCRDHLGLGFAGAPGWEQLGHRKVAVRTHMDLGEQLRAARATLDRMRRPSD